MIPNHGRPVGGGRQVNRPRAGRIRFAAVVLQVAVLLLSGCASHGGVNSSSGGPLIVCGTTLSVTAAAPVLYGATGSGTLTVRGTSSNHIFVQTSKTCETGASLAIVPSAGATPIKVVHATDGHVAAVVLTPLQADFQIIVSHPDGSRFTVKVDLQGFEPASPTPTHT